MFLPELIVLLAKWKLDLDASSRVVNIPLSKVSLLWTLTFPSIVGLFPLLVLVSIVVGARFNAMGSDFNDKDFCSAMECWKVEGKREWLRVLGGLPKLVDHSFWWELHMVSDFILIKLRLYMCQNSHTFNCNDYPR